MPGQTKEREEAVRGILQSLEKKLKDTELKATIGDYIRLVQMEKEMTPEMKTELKVMWIEEPETTQRE